MAVFWDVTECRLAETDQHFTAAHCLLYLTGESVLQFHINGNYGKMNNNSKK
jgi:hypothetical protein